MAVRIENMDMPKSCIECPFLDYGSVCAVDNELCSELLDFDMMDLEERPKDCPLKEIKECE